MKKYRNGMIPLLILLLCLATSGLNIANHVPSGLNRQTGQNHTTYQDGGSIQDIEDSFPPKASFSSGGDIPSEATVSDDGDVSDDNTTASSIDVESSEATTGESHAADLVLSANDRNYKLVATVPSNAQLSEDTELKVNQIKANSDQYIGFRDEVREVLTEELAESSHDRIDIDSFMLFDISFTEDGKEVRPAEPVSVGIDLKLKSKELVGLDNAVVVHVDREKGVELLDNHCIENDGKGNVIANFETDAFSYFAIVGTTIEKSFVASDGKNYKVTVTAGADSGIPAGAELEVTEVPDNSDEYKAYVSKTESVLDETEKVTFARFFDISIMADGKEIQPKGQVEVKIELADQLMEDVKTVHFAQGNGHDVTPVLLDTKLAEPETLKDAVQFETDGFSVYGVVMTELFTEVVLPGSNDAYTVTVTAPPEAKIPEGSELRVKSLEEGTEAYTYARNAVFADRKEKGEPTDEGLFNLAALDISIIGPDGKELEPAAAVTVDIQIKELPGVEDLKQVEQTLEIQHHVEVKDGVVVQKVFDGSDEGSFRMETAEKVAAEGTVVDPNSVRDEEKELDVSFATEVFSTFTITWTTSGYSGYVWTNTTNNVTVHYVDENGKELTVANKKLPTKLNEKSTSPAFLIYDIDGYEFSYSYLNNKNTKIKPQVKLSSSKWKYSTDGSNWKDLSDKSNIYIVYKKKADVAQGGTPTVKQTGTVTPPKTPTIDKQSRPNGDGTNTLSLSITSHTKALEVETPADVIVVFDVSGSMGESMSGSTRLKVAKNAVNNLVDQLAAKKNAKGEPLVRMSLIKFSTTASNVTGMTELNTNGVTAFKKKVDALTANGGTNWDHALQLANEENDLDPGRATFVIFVTDGDPTFRNTRTDVTDSVLDMFKSYGNEQYYLSDSVFGEGDKDTYERNYNAAVTQGQAIVAANKSLYTIGISKDVTKVDKFNRAVGGEGAFLAKDSDALKKAFDDIHSSISALMGYGNIQMTDGITNLSNTVAKSGLTNVGSDFTYWKKEKGKTEFAPWDPSSERAEEAVYNSETGAVEWNMGANFMPEDGVTYQVRFIVWPSQEAYDYIAKLNNNTVSYESLPPEVQAQIIRSGSVYTLKTNEPNANTTYQSATKTGGVVTVSGEIEKLFFPTVDDLGLSVDRMLVEKEWINDLDQEARWKSDVNLLLKDENGNLYKEIPLNQENQWSARENFISCGLMKVVDNQLVIYETGHDFTLSEPSDYAYYWELDSGIYRPMIINNTLTMLEKVEKPAGMGDRTYYTTKGNHYYQISGGTYHAIASGDAAATLTATNIRRSNLNLTKKVVDEMGKEITSSDLFEFTVTIAEKKGDDVWFSVYDPVAKETIIDLTTDAAAESDDKGNKTGFYYAKSGTPISVSMKPGWNLRFTNLPNGTSYTITETEMPGYTFLNAAVDQGGTFAVKDGTTTGSGVIDAPNKQYTVTYTNRSRLPRLRIVKAMAGNTGIKLNGAKFKLYAIDNHDTEKTGKEVGEFTTSGTYRDATAQGYVDIGVLMMGQYRLVETEPPHGFSLAPDIEFVVGADSVKNADGELFPIKDGVYVIQMEDPLNYNLPSSGSIGTYYHTSFGAAAMALPLLLYLRGRKREDRA